MYQRLLVRIPAPYTGWTFFTFVCCKNCSVCLKRRKRGRGWPFLKKILCIIMTIKKAFNLIGLFTIYPFVHLFIVTLQVNQVNCGVTIANLFTIYYYTMTIDLLSLINCIILPVLSCEEVKELIKRGTTAIRLFCLI